MKTMKGRIAVPASAPGRIGLALASLGVLLVLAGAGTSDRAAAIGLPSILDGVGLGLIGFVLFAAGAIILAEKG